MRYALCYGACVACGKTFAFNPTKVPSIRVGGVREPVCAGCIATANESRVAKGLPPHAIHPDAYEPCEEGELS